MGHISQEDLRREIDQAKTLVESGAKYVHFKHPDQAYLVIGFAVREDSQEVCVIYEAQYGERIPFIRTLQSFIGTVEHEGRTVLRFTKIV
jgi:hypothetical protein